MGERTWFLTSSVISANDLSSLPLNGSVLRDDPPPPPGGGGGGGPPPPPGGRAGGTVPITSLQQNLILYGYIILFLLGFFGHVNTIIIFLRRILRSVSTSCLFVGVAISDTVYLLVCIYDFLYTGLGLTYISQQNNSGLANHLCRFRSFIQSVAMCSSSWLLLSIAVDRWLRIRFPFQVRKLCTIKRALLATTIVVVCAVTMSSHLLIPSLGNLSSINICGPVGTTDYAFFFRQVWGVLFTCLQTVFPTVLLLLLTVDMFYRQTRRINQNRRRAFLDRQMLIIMLTSIFLFFCTQTPLGIFNILLQSVIRFRLTQTRAVELTTVFRLIASIHFSMTFYIHCLTSNLFRTEFLKTLHCGRRQRIGVTPPMADNRARNGPPRPMNGPRAAWIGWNPSGSTNVVRKG